MPTRRRFLRLSAGLAAAAVGCSLPGAALAQTATPFQAEVRVYHEIAYSRFKRDILNLLDTGVQPLSIETIVGALNGSLSIPAGLRTFHITWDDARLSQYTDGWRAIDEIARERGVYVPVTAFLITKFEHLAGPLAQMPDDTPCYSEDGNAPGRHRFMTKAQAVELIRRGVHAGNHTVNHADLPALSPAAQAGELVVADRRIQELWELAGVTRPVKVFAYPYGHFNPDLIALLQALKYDAAFSTLRRTTESPADRFTLGRLGSS